MEPRLALMLPLLLLMLRTARSGEAVDVPREAEEEETEPGFTQRIVSVQPRAEDAESGQQQVTPPPAGPELVLRLSVVDSLSGRSLDLVSLVVFVNSSETAAALTSVSGEAWFSLTRAHGAAVSVLARKRGYVPTLLPVPTDHLPVFSSVTLALLGLNRGNMWLFNDSVVVSSESTVLGVRPMVQFPRSALNLTDDDALSEVTAFMNSPSLSPPEGAVLLRTSGPISANSGSSVMQMVTPVASAFVQLCSSSPSSSDFVELNVSGPISLSLTLSQSCGLQEGAHVPAWNLDMQTGQWTRRGLGTVQSVDGTLVWTFAVPHLGHWLAAPLSPSVGERLELHVDFLLRHGSFLMMVLGSTLTVAVCLLFGLFCCPRSRHKDPKVRRPAVNPLFYVKDQSTSTSEDQYRLTLYDPDAQNHDSHRPSTETVNGPDAQIHQNHFPSTETEDGSEEKILNHTQNLGNGFLLYPQPLTVLTAPGLFHLRPDWSQPLAPDQLSSTHHTDKKHADEERADEERRGDPGHKLEVKTGKSRLSESVSEPGTLTYTGPRAWFVSLEGKSAAEIHYGVCEEQRRSQVITDTSLDSGLDLTEPGQSRPGQGQERRLERNATFVKKSQRSQEQEPQ